MITLADGKRWLLDCGRQAPDQVYQSGLTWYDIEGQIITHVHGDHVYGLEDFAFVRFFESLGPNKSTRGGGPAPKLVAHSAVLGEVWEVLAPSLRYLRDQDGSPIAGTLGDYFEVIAPSAVEPPRRNAWRHAEHFVAGELGLTCRESEHVPGKPSCSLEIKVGKGRSKKIAWWSGDSTVDAAFLARIEPETTVFFHDCTFVDYPGQVHGFFRLLAALPEVVRKKMVLMHHEDNIEEHRAKVEAAGFRVALPGHVYDLVRGQRIE